MGTTIEPHKLNKRERRAAALLAHYATCERLAVAMGMPAEKVDGKKISVALLKIERDASNASTAQCNGADYNGQPYREDYGQDGEESDETPFETFAASIRDAVSRVFGCSHMHPLPGFLYNRDPRGCALKIDPDNAEGRALIESCRLHTDLGGYGCLSPEITGHKRGAALNR